MRATREAKKYLFDVLSSCNEIARFVDGYSLDQYLENPLVRRAVERDLEIIGEALVQLRAVAPEIAASIADIQRIIGMRNRLVHAYAEVDDEIVWDAATQEVPLLAIAVRNLLN